MVFENTTQLDVARCLNPRLSVNCCTPPVRERGDEKKTKGEVRRPRRSGNKEVRKRTHQAGTRGVEEVNCE